MKLYDEWDLLQNIHCTGLGGRDPSINKSRLDMNQYSWKLSDRNQGLVILISLLPYV